MVENGIDPAQMKGSWAGAMGQPQFMPTSYLKYAVDFDGDGDKDIWNSVPDALGSIANYLVQKGWQRGRGWGYEVDHPIRRILRPGRSQILPGRSRTGSGCRHHPHLGQSLRHRARLKADTMMLVPAGRHGPEFIVTPNFYVIKEYNNSDLYALFIGNLADRIAYGSGFLHEPNGARSVTCCARMSSRCRTRLAKMGHDVGKIDGLPGFKTRRSIGRWQEKNGMAPTCYPDEALLGKLR